MMKKAIVTGLMLLSTFSMEASAWDKLSGHSAGIREKLCVAVRSQQEWINLWVKHTAGRAETRPAVDFTKEMVVAVFLGVRNTGGYKVDVKVMADPIEPKSHIVVFYREVPPQAGFNVQMVTQPFIMVKVPKKPKVDFEEDGAVSIPEKQQQPQSVFTPDQQMHIQKTMDHLKDISGDSMTIFR